jgi:hypothetical protein
LWSIQLYDIIKNKTISGKNHYTFH